MYVVPPCHHIVWWTSQSVNDFVDKGRSEYVTRQSNKAKQRKMHEKMGFYKSDLSDKSITLSVYSKKYVDSPICRIHYIIFDSSRLK